MSIHLSARHCELSEDEKTMIMEKIESGMKIYPQIVRDIHIAVTQENYYFTVEAVIQLTRNKTLTAISSDKDLRVAVDDVQSKAGTQLRRVKEKIDDYHKHGRPPRRVAPAE